MKFLEPEQFLPKLNQIYQDLSIQIKNILPTADVEHIGSSAIQGALSKGDLDILVRVNRSEFEAAITSIMNLGFKIKTDTLKDENLCMLITSQLSEDVAIQLITRNSQYEDFVKFRDILNQNQDLIIKYNQLKLESVGDSPDTYRSKKSKFIQEVLSRNSKFE